jgi:hypothetical protein
MKFTVSGFPESGEFTSEGSLVPLLECEDDHRVDDKNERDSESGVQAAEALLLDNVLHSLDHRQVLVVDLFLANYEIGNH